MEHNITMHPQCCLFTCHLHLPLWNAQKANTLFIKWGWKHSFIENLSSNHSTVLSSHLLRWIDKRKHHPKNVKTFIICSAALSWGPNEDSSFRPQDSIALHLKQNPLKLQTRSFFFFFKSYRHLVPIPEFCIKISPNLLRWKYCSLSKSAPLRKHQRSSNLPPPLKLPQSPDHEISGDSLNFLPVQPI